MFFNSFSYCIEYIVCFISNKFKFNSQAGLFKADPVNFTSTHSDLSLLKKALNAYFSKNLSYNPLP